VDRVAPEVVAPPPPDARPDVVETPQVSPDPGEAPPQEPQEATAPEQATDRIRPDPVPDPVIAALAPPASRRPPSARPDRPQPTAAPAPTPAPQQTPEPTPEPQQTQTPAPTPEPAETRDAVADALAEALGGATQAPAGPPLSAGEKEAMRVAVSQCWNVGSLSSAAMATTVVVAVDMGQDGMPDANSIRLLSSSGGDDSSARQAFEAARRAIIRCARGGYALPAEKYAHWREIEMTFNPERMRIR
jgi:hypothetical protein